MPRAGRALTGGAEAILPEATCDSMGTQSSVFPLGVVVVLTIFNALCRPFNQLESSGFNIFTLIYATYMDDPGIGAPH